LANLTQKQAAGIVAWFRETAMGMQDWAIELYLTDKPPEWADSPGADDMGQSDSEPQQKRARVWVSPARCDEQGDDPRSVLLHELMHVVFVDVGVDDGPDRVHYLVWRFGEILLKAWLRDGGAKCA